MAPDLATPDPAKANAAAAKVKKAAAGLSSYLKDKARQMKVFTLDFNVALIVTVIAALGTYFNVAACGKALRLQPREGPHSTRRKSRRPRT